MYNDNISPFINIKFIIHLLKITLFELINVNIINKLRTAESSTVPYMFSFEISMFLQETLKVLLIQCGAYMLHHSGSEKVGLLKGFSLVCPHGPEGRIGSKMTVSCPY